MKRQKSTAFTLAEVLITLGIVGIVAALTLPNVIANFKRKQLEIQFKKIDSTIEQALLKTRAELGIDDLRKVIEINKDNPEQLKAEFIEINKVFEKQLNYVKKSHNIDLGQTKHQEFFGKDRIYCNHFSSGRLPLNEYYYYFLPDGSIISSIDYGIRSKETLISVDINGLKGPNRRGYDIFLYGSNWACDPLMVATDNLVGCYPFAQKNVNPINKSAKYWDSLYRPKSYWQNLRNN